MSRSPKLQRLTSMAVPALLAANAMVLVLGLATITDDSPAAPETVTYIKAADGSLIEVDPTTPEGWKAIAEAEQRGDEIVTVDETEQPAEVQQQQAPTTTLLPDVDKVLDDTEATIVETVDKVGQTVDSVVDDVTDIVDDNAGTNLGDTLDPQVDEGTDTLTTTVSTVVRETRNTATTVVDEVEDVVDTVTTAVPAPATTLPTVQLPVPTTLPDLGL